MNVGTIKLFCWLASILMLTALTLGAGQFMTNIDKHRYPVAKEYVEQVLADDQQLQVDVHEGLNYDKDVTPTFLNMNWTGKPKPKVTAPIVGPKEDQVITRKPIAEALRILFILRDSSDPSESYATAVPLKGAKQETLNLKVGDRLPQPNEHAIVHMIHDESVEFAFTDERENENVLLRPLSPDIVIVKEGDPISEAAKLAIPKGSDGKSKRPQDTERLANNHYILGDNDLALFEQDYSRILTEDVRTRTYYDKDGNRAGVEIQSVTEGSIAAKHGAMSGDVIISINGHKVYSEQEAIQFAKQNSDKYNVWTVEVLRLGRIETIVYNTGD